MIALQNLWKMFFYFNKSSFCSRDIQIFVFSSFSLFLPVSHCFKGWSKKNLQVYDFINCLNKVLIKHFVWFLEKKIRCDIETLSIDTALNKEHFLWKNQAENVHQKLVPVLCLILLNNPKQPLHVKSSFKNKISWKGIIKRLLKS